MREIYRQPNQGKNCNGESNGEDDPLDKTEIPFFSGRVPA